MKSHTTIILMANVIKTALGVKLTPEEQTLENNLKKALANAG